MPVQNNEQTIALEVRGGGQLLSHTTTWRRDADAPAVTIELPQDGEIHFTSASVGRISIEGQNLNLDLSRSQAGLRVFTWLAPGHDGDEVAITIAHPNGDFPELTLNIVHAEEANLEVEEESPRAPAPSPTDSPMDYLLEFIGGYGAYVVSGIAVIGALLFALAMPAHRTEIISAAGAIGLWSYFATSEGDRFGLRILLFAAAAVVMFFAMAMPGSTDQLLEGAGVLCALAIYFGDQF